MNADIPVIPVLVIGKEMDGLNSSRLEQLVYKFKGRYGFAPYGPMMEEPDVLDAVEKIRRRGSRLILVDVLQGGSARAVTLAAVKSGIPSAIWCHDEKHSLASSSIAAGVLKQLGLPYVLLHGKETDVEKGLDSATKAACALKALSDARIGQLGPLHHNLINSTVDPNVLLERFGTWVVPLSVSALEKDVGEVDTARVEKEIEWLKTGYAVETDGGILRKAVAFRLALKDLAAEKRLDAVAVDCWNEVIPMLGINPCLEFAYNDFIIGCEGDIILALAMLAGKAMSGMPGYCGDLYSLDEATGVASLMHCTGCSRLHGGEGRIEISCRQPPNSIGLESGIVALKPHLARGPGVLVLLHGRNLEYLHLRDCEIVRSDFSNQMQVFVKIEGDIADFGSEVAGNHYAVFSGDLSGAWKTWALWSGITVH